MNRPLLLFAFVISALLFFGCGAAGEAGKDDSTHSDDSAAENKDESACWPKAEFNNMDLGEDDMGVPHTIVRVTVCDELVVIDTVIGSMDPYNTDVYKDMEIPDKAIDACGGWFAGGGDYFYIVPDHDGVEVFHGWQDEGQTDAGYHWEQVREIH